MSLIKKYLAVSHFNDATDVKIVFAIVKEYVDICKIYDANI